MRGVKSPSNCTSVGASCTNDSTGLLAGEPAVARGDCAVDDDCIDADGRAPRLIPGCPGGDGRRVEHDEVRRETLRDSAPIADAEAGSRQTAHQVDRPLEGHECTVADEGPEDLGE